jgi:lipopolysaccharide export system protein LptA
MRLTIERIRTLILVVAISLLAILSGLLFIAHSRIGKILDLPRKLDRAILQTANGFTISPSRGGHTLFTLHAANVTQYKDGKRSLLKKVSIIFYGAEGNREDHLYGDEFDYDPESGIATAHGPVGIDLGPKRNKDENKKDIAARQIHVKTSGVTFNQKSGEVSTGELVSVAFEQTSGSAAGAIYHSNEGKLELAHSLEFHAMQKGRDYTLRATHGEFERDARTGHLDHATLELERGKAEATVADVSLREDGSLDVIKARNGISYDGDDGSHFQSSTGEFYANEKNHPVRAHLDGGLLYTQQTAGSYAKGTSTEGWFDFNASGELKHLRIADRVEYSSHESALDATRNHPARASADRSLRARQLEIEFVQDARHHTHPKQMLATGQAMASNLEQQPHQNPESITVEGEKLLAGFDAGGQPQTLDGEGATRLTELARDGSLQTSTGAKLHMLFFSQKGMSASHNAKLRQKPEIEQAVQQGNVAILSQPAPSRSKDEQPTHASAARADYDGEQQRLKLTGSPRILSGGLDLTAHQIEILRTTGDALATGNVQATYLSQSTPGSTVLGGREPAHMIAEEAQMTRKTGETVFRHNARLWQGQDAISAPTITMERGRQSLHASGSASQPVRASLLMAGSARNPSSVLRVASREFDYRDKERKGVFREKVLAETGYASTTADICTVFLSETRAGEKNTPVANSPQKLPSDQAAAQVERMLLEGSVQLLAPGRKGTGAQLDYHASTGEFALTGTSKAPPMLEDATRGTVTGNALIFNTHDDSVRVESHGAPTVTDTTVPK